VGKGSLPVVVMKKNNILSMGHKIYASYDEKNITVYQAYNDIIADYVVKNKKFLDGFSFRRMTWIKPSFLWMMYRSGWGSKDGQKRVLAIDIKRDVFDLFVTNAILSSFTDKLYNSKEEWRILLSKSDVRCQWDPERDIYGHSIDRRSVQIGIQGEMLYKYNDSIINVLDITEKVSMIKKSIDLNVFEESLLPKEVEYVVNLSN